MNNAPYNFATISSQGGSKALKTLLIRGGATEALLTQRAGVAATLALSDGPLLPFGDIAGALLLAYSFWEVSEMAKQQGAYNPAWNNYTQNSGYNASMKNTFEEVLGNLFIIPSDNRATGLPHILDDDKYLNEGPSIRGMKPSIYDKKHVTVIPPLKKQVEFGGIQVRENKDPIFIHFPVPQNRNLNDFIRFILAEFERQRAGIDEAYEVFMVGKNGEDLGSMTIKPEEGTITLEYLHVNKQYRGRGLANNALDEFCRIAKAQGATEIHLEASSVGENSLSATQLAELYSRKLGLEVTATNGDNSISMSGSVNNQDVEAGAEAAEEFSSYTY